MVWLYKSQSWRGNIGIYIILRRSTPSYRHPDSPLRKSCSSVHSLIQMFTFRLGAIIENDNKLNSYERLLFRRLYRGKKMFRLDHSEEESKPSFQDICWYCCELNCYERWKVTTQKLIQVHFNTLLNKKQLLY